MAEFECDVTVVAEISFTVTADSEAEAREIASNIALTERGGWGEDSSLTVESEDERLTIDRLDWGLYDIPVHLVSIHQITA